MSVRWGEFTVLRGVGVPYHAIDDAARLRRLLDAVLDVQHDLDLPATLQRVAEAATSLAGARYGALGVLDETGRGLADFYTAGIDPEVRRAVGHLPAGRGILGLLIAEPKPIRLPDLTRHPDSAGFPPGHPPMTSFLGVPIRVGPEVFGNLYLTDKLGAEGFSEADEELIVALAAAAGIAIQNARLHARVGELGRLEDRERIARDLHDTVIQRLFAVGLNLQGVSDLTRVPEVGARVLEAIDQLDRTIHQIRTTIFALARPGAETGLRTRVSGLVEEVAPALGFRPTVRFDGAVDAAASKDVAAELLAILREALTNVARHAGASLTEITVSLRGQEVVLEVLDNGVGVPAAPGATGHGIPNMVRRAEYLGGELVLRNRAEGGSHLACSVPIPSREPSHDRPDRPAAG